MKKSRFAIASVLAIAPMAVSFACAGKVAVDAADTGPSSTATGTPEKCAACVNAKCKATWDACLADVFCSAQTDCIAACHDADCEAACRSSRPSRLGDETQACFRGPCAADCTH